MNFMNKKNLGKIMACTTATFLMLSPYVGAIPPKVSIEQITGQPAVEVPINDLHNMTDGQLSSYLGTKDKSQLLPLLFSLWLTFLSSLDAARYAAERAVGVAASEALDAARKAAVDAAWDAAYNAAMDAAIEAAHRAAMEAAERAATEAAEFAAWEAAHRAAFVRSWQPGGATYNIVTSDSNTYTDAYFRNLVKVLVQQTKILQNATSFVE